jgi:hypothetical protein
MQEVENDNQDIYEERLVKDKITENISLSKRLINGAEEIVDRIINIEEDKEGLRLVLLLRHPKTGMEPTMAEIKQCLTDLPAYILTIHSQYLYIKRQKEKLLSVLRPKAERLIAEERMELKKEKMPLSLFGQITKEDLRDRIVASPEFNELSKLEEEESTLEMIIKLLESRRYELSKILDVELHGA